jgi:hypothetical protein
MSVIGSKVDLSSASESSASGVSWPPIIAGALAAAAITLVLTLLGTGLGLTMVSPWSSQSATAATVSISAAVWLIVVQWLSAGVGGYLTGRLRTKWVSVHTDEVYFRDTAHGLLTWALATLIVVGVLSSAVSSLIGAGVRAAATATSGAATVAVSKASDSTGGSSYFVDSLLRPADPRRPAGNGSDTSASQVATILANSTMTGPMSAEDQAYLTQLVAAKAGLSDTDAKARVDTVLKNVDNAKAKAQQMAEVARKATAKIALFGTLSLLIGAFIAAVAAVIGGRERDNMQAF